MAVNFAHGHGLVFGGVEPFAQYAFDPGAEGEPIFGQFTDYGKNGGWRRFYRTPGYPFLLGVLYTEAGVRPELAKKIQWQLLLLSACSLFWIGTLLWGWIGFAAAALAFTRIFQDLRPFADNLLTESVIVFALVAWTATSVLTLRRRSPASGFLLGAVCGGVALIKGNMIFLGPLLIGALVLREFVTAERWRAFAVALALGLIGVVGSYSVYASHAAGHPVLLSEQGSHILLDGNNEAAVRSGTWSPSWRANPAAFFNQPAQQGLPAWRQVVRFYAEDPQYLLPALGRKLRAAYGEKRDAVVALALATLGLAGLLIQGRWKQAVGLLSHPLVVITFNFLLITLLFFGEPRFVSVSFWCFTLGLSAVVIEALLWTTRQVRQWLRPRGATP